MKTKGNKKLQIDKNQATTFAFIALASIVTVMSLMISKSLWDQSRYVGRVNDKKKTALRELKNNEAAVDKLSAAYKVFNDQSTNLIQGSKDGPGLKDGSNGSLILDALPTEYDFPALTSSIEGLLFGYEVKSISGSDDMIAQQDAGQGGQVEMPFTFEVGANYQSTKDLINTFHRSIRPFHITRLEITGSSNLLRVNVSAKTFYQPKTSLNITEETVK